MTTDAHPFAGQWNHNTHHYPLLRDGLPGSARRVLDVGCGDGTLCRYVATPGRLVVGLDPDPRHLTPGEGVAYVVGSAEALGFADHSFDAVTVVAALHHVDAGHALAEAARVLAPGGSLQVLGVARYGGPRDLPHELRDVVAHRWHRLRHAEWEPPTTKTPPRETWAEVQALTRTALPGRTWQRLPLWRYLITWTKPA